MSVATAGLCQGPQAGFTPAFGAAQAASLNGPLEVSWADSEADVRAVQALRYQVFAGEMGARLSPPPGTPAGLDADRFDPFCDHLMVRAGRDEHENRPGVLLGTYRVLSPGAAKRAGGFYADTEFDLGPLHALRPHAVELGRACVHSAWRSGGVIMMLWAALGRYMATHQLDTMIGCASIGLSDGGQAARRLWRDLRQTHLVEAPWQVRPRVPLSHQGSMDPAEACTIADVPPLIKGYLRCGARLLGPPALDSAFNTADLPLMLRTQEMNPRYHKHFITHRA